MNSVLSIPQMIALEKRAFADGVDAWALMQEAGRQMTNAIQQRYPEPGRCRVFAGKGNNGGDTWVVARLLAESGWSVKVTCPFSEAEMSELAKRASADWRKMAVNQKPVSNHARKPLIVVDGLLGIGVKGEIRSPISDLIEEIARVSALGAVVFAADLPSGLGTNRCVVADHTLTVGCAKDVLLADEAAHFVGRISVLPLTELSCRVIEKTSAEVATAEDLRSLLPPRSFDVHKGLFGRVMLVAGSEGTPGAAVLAAHGVLRGGVGLLSLVCPPDVFSTLAPMLPPEVMSRPWENLTEVANEKMDVLAIGPGLDPRWSKSVWALLEASQVPMILDAGALTILAVDLPRAKQLKTPLLFTPHPGEMERLEPQKNRTRAQWAANFVESFGNDSLTLLLKGSRTLVAQSGHPPSYNTTGHPGMATGGMGDTLTGVCAALLAQGLTTRDAARLGAWVCGRAAEIAIQEDGQSQESLLPTDLANRLGSAFSDLRAGGY